MYYYIVLPYTLLMFRHNVHLTYVVYETVEYPCFIGRNLLELVGPLVLWSIPKIPRKVTNAVYWRNDLSKGIWKFPEVESVMARLACRELEIRSIISDMLGICHPLFEITSLRLRKYSVNRHPLVGLHTRYPCDHAVARGCMTCKSNKSSIIWFSVECFSTDT